MYHQRVPYSVFGSLSKHRTLALTVALIVSLVNVLASPTEYSPSTLQPPHPLREFRGAWVATVGNIDWPSLPGLTTQQQKSELLAILDRAVHLHLNAILFQVRPACDAFYASRLEPWSEYLTGQMGRAPSPSYDPLAFAAEEAHKRGIELHAWFNPFRARSNRTVSPVTSRHISKTRPQWVKPYGTQLWLDPGEPDVHEYSRRIILDVVKRYDIDGVHLDDYFYPYPEKDSRGQALPFPDWSSWNRYKAAGGKLTREDWRRENVNRFIEQLYAAIKSEKPFVKFGLSPFGIWRPGFPNQIRGFDAYENLFADSKKWFNQGWLDYFTPQLYWNIEPREQSYPVLLKWWAEQNTRQRHLWPGDAPSRIGPNRSTHEFLDQVRLTRQQPGATGNIHWNMSALMQNRGGVADALLNDLYSHPAVIPACPWLDPSLPGKPSLTATDAGKAGVNLSWSSTPGNKPWLWLLQTKSRSEWTTEILPAHQGSYHLRTTHEAIALTALTRCGNAGPAAVLARQPHE